MSARTSPIGSRRPAVGARARELAARLSALFLADQAVAVRQADAQRRLTDANDRLCSGLAPDALGLIYDGAAPAGHSQIAKLIDAGPGSQTTLLGALQETHWQVHRAFCEYQSACEERRQLAADVGEAIRQFTRRARRGGLDRGQARNANVHQLAAGDRRRGDRAMSQPRNPKTAGAGGAGRGARPRAAPARDPLPLPAARRRGDPRAADAARVPRRAAGSRGRKNAPSAASDAG